MYQSTTEESVLIGHGREFIRKPVEEWRSAVRRGTDHMRQRLSFMTPEHHKVRNFVVAGLVRYRRPLEAAAIANQTGCLLYTSDAADE